MPVRAERTFLWLIVAALLLQVSSSAVLALGQDNGSPVVIHMTDEMKFVPNRLTIRAGQTVEWVNDAEAGGPAHSVTTNPEKAMDPNHVSSPQGAEPFDSGTIKPGKSFTYTFKVPGVYRYVCAPHEGKMRGEITVEP